MPSAISQTNATDDFISDNLPAWLHAATPQQIAALQERFAAYRSAETTLHQALKPLEAPQAFARTLLGEQIKNKLHLNLDLEKALWRQRLDGFSLLGGETLINHDTIEPAMHHVMQNFADGTPLDARTGLIAAHQGTHTDNEELLVDSARFISLCREVDAGQRYQTHLNTVLDAALQSALVQEQRRRFALSLEIARVQRTLSEGEIAVLLPTLGEHDPALPLSLGVSIKHLQLLGCSIIGGVTVEWSIDSAPSVTRPDQVLLYLPHRDLQRFDDWAAMTTHLITLLQDQHEQASLLARIQLKDRPGFISTLAKRLKDPSPDIEAVGQLASQDLFVELADQHLKKIREDARYLLVPVADVDDNAKWQRLQTFEAVGSNLLQFAGMFVPALGQLLMAEMVGEVLKEVYEGCHDWARGHQHEAVEHMLGVAEMIAVNALAAAGGVAVARGFKRSAFVDELVPISQHALPNKLWAHDLAPYRARQVPARLRRNATGLYVHGDRRWWLHAGRLHEVIYDHASARWRLGRADDRPGFAPALSWNGECGWRLVWQRPQEWHGTAALLGHLWPLSPSIGEQRIGQILSIADTSETTLRRLVAEQRSLPTALRDTLERFSADARINDFFRAVGEASTVLDERILELCLEQLPAHLRMADTRLQAIGERAPVLRQQLMDQLDVEVFTSGLLPAMRRIFPSLPDRYASGVIRQASFDEQQRLAQRGSLSLGMAERARLAMHDARICRLLQSLYLHNGYHQELPKLVFALMRKQPAWPQEINFEVREAGVDGRLIAQLYPADGRYPPKVLVWSHGRMQVYGDSTRLPGDSVGEGDLLQTMRHYLAEADRQRLGWTTDASLQALRSNLQRRLPESRTALLEMLAIKAPEATFRPPTRLPDGRFGYLLSGRGSSNHLAERTLQDRVRSLFPGFNAQQLELYLQLLQDHPGSAFSVLLEEEQSYQQLHQNLQRWTAQGGSAIRRPMRRMVADEIRRCWRMQGLAGRPQQDGTPGMVLVLSAYAAGDLPDLSGQRGLRHVTEISLSNMQLSAVADGFLQPFVNLQSLNLDNNSLTALPPGLTQMRHLQELYLARNNLQMNPANTAVLAQLQQLRVLNLSDNNLQHFTFPLNRLPRLRQLGLHNTGLRSVPERLMLGISLDYVDLRDNLIAALPQPLRDNRTYWRRRLALIGNPLPDAYDERWLDGGTSSESEASVGGENVPRERWLEQLDGDARTLRNAQWDRLAEEADSADFLRLVEDLVHTSDFRLARADLEARLWRMFDAVEHNTALREELFALASQPRSCVDSVMSCFSMLEVRTLAAGAITGAAGNDEAGLLQLARRLFRLDQVEAYAREDMNRRHAQGRGVDEVEVSLAYRVGLAARLDLPGQPQTMQFEAIGGVTRADLDDALAAVHAAETGDALVQYISQRDFWLQYLRHEHGAVFESVEEPFWARMEALDAQRDGVDDARYLLEVNQVASDRQAALEAQAIQLTRAALGNEPLAPPP